MSDWSSDVSSSDLLALFRAAVRAEPVAFGGDDLTIGQAGYHFGYPHGRPGALRSQLLGRGGMRVRWDARREGKDCVSTCSSRAWPYHEQHNTLRPTTISYTRVAPR